MESNKKIINDDGFLLPNLCEYQALLILIIAGQLLVFAFVIHKFGFSFDWTYVGQVSLYVQWQSMMSTVVLCKFRYHIANFPKNKAVFLTYVILLTIGLVLSIIVQWQFMPYNFGRFDWEFVLRNLVLSAIIIGIALRYLYVQQKLIQRQKSELSANLKALQARIKPHFLFNTMNSIASLITIEPEKAELMVEDLAELLRASLRDGVVETSIDEEWHICERYIQIEQQRIGDRMQCEADFKGMDTTLPIPSLALQPIIENAIYHGIQPNPEPGYIKVKGVSDGRKVTITVENSRTEEGMASGRNGNRMAVNNIRRRIEQLYGDSASLTLQEREGSYLVVLQYEVPEDSERLET